ncbi:MAG: hypothetical protein K6G47_03715 [Clostridia bacterium]|nr:hypothetical protein [Clostridia bacterium]
MKKLILTLTSALVLTGLLCSCGSYEPIVEPTSDTTASEATSEETTEATTETTKEEIVYNYESEIPTDYTMSFKGGESGTVEKITYTAKDYIGDGEGCEKSAFVYLPAGYDPEGQYNVIYLMHGIGGNEYEWGLNLEASELKFIFDNLIGNGDIDPVIVVTPNGKALGCKHDQDMDSFYNFGYELRNDLIPYIEENYATYAEFSADGYDLSATREHRAMAGLSMGGMQTINIGIGECMDLFSWFGAFSAAPTSNAASVTAATINDSEYTVDYFYNICGTEDDIAYSSASNAAKTLPDICDKMIPNENFTWQQQEGGHDWPIWYLGIYNFAKIAFNK